MQVISAESTELFVGPPDAPLQLARVTVAGVAEPTPVRIDGDGLSGEAVAEPGDEVIEVPVTVARPVVGQRRAARVHAAGASAHFEFAIAEPGWTMFMVSHFHYDPVWWNTQGAYTSEWREDPPGRPADQRLRAGARASGDGPPRARVQVRAGRSGLPQAVLGHPPRGPRRPAPVHRAGPRRGDGRHLQRTQHQPHRPGDNHPKPGARHGFSA